MSNGEKKGEHLKAHQWKPGQTGNAGGRPKGYERRIREVIDSMTAADPDTEVDPEVEADGEPKRIPAWEAIVKRAVIDAVAGDKYARDFVADRLMGKPKQNVTFDGSLTTNVEPIELPPMTEEQLLIAALLDEPGAPATEH